MNKLVASEVVAEPEARQELEVYPSDDSPSVTYETITFSDGTLFNLDPTDVLVLVGPNNAGKSLALRELEENIGADPIEKKVVASTQCCKVGTKEGFANFVERHTQIKAQGSSMIYTGRAGLFQHTTDKPEDRWPDQIQAFSPLFCKRIPSETRISDSDPVDAIDVQEEPLDHPIHMLYSDDELERKISTHFRNAFGQDLILDRGAGKTWPLRVGPRLSPDCGNSPFSTTFLSRQRDSTLPLSQQGDGMRSFASVVLHLLAPSSPSLLLLDEPEAFLHPSQARLLGEIIATEKSPRAQLFLATHSPDVLQGLINVAPEHLRVLRMQRDGNVNQIKELDKELVKKISYDPIMRYTSVLSGLFHERVIICEADADCMFYSSILDLPEVHGETHPDVLFVHANGKHRMATLAETLVSLDVPIDIVADIDVLNDLTVLEKIVKALRGDWEQIGPLADALKKEIEISEPLLSFDDIRISVRKEVDKAPADHNPAKDLRSRIDDIFPQSTPWGAIKRGGKASLPPGQAAQRFERIQALCSQAGLWIVPVGELEGFCKLIGRKGPAWVQQVVGERNLATDPALGPARKFVKQIWEGKRSCAAGDMA